jgi:hypothetical protein
MIDATKLGRVHALTASVLLLATAACASGQETAMNALTEAERASGWTLLFDGSSLDGWRGYGRDEAPDGWAAVDGTLTLVARAGDLITRAQYEDFEVAFEWMVGPGGNSGVFYRAVEGLPLIYHGAPEYQVLDDAGHVDGQSPLTSAGSNYGLDPAPRGLVKPAGEWNSGRIVVEGNRVEHWLNGAKAVDYELHSEAWTTSVANSKFDAWPAYGQARRGHIGLQDHGDQVWYRNIKLREIR